MDSTVSVSDNRRRSLPVLLGNANAPVSNDDIHAGNLWLEPETLPKALPQVDAVMTHQAKTSNRFCLPENTRGKWESKFRTSLPDREVVSIIFNVREQCIGEEPQEATKRDLSRERAHALELACQRMSVDELQDAIVASGPLTNMQGTEGTEEGDGGRSLIESAPSIIGHTAREQDETESAPSMIIDTTRGHDEFESEKAARDKLQSGRETMDITGGWLNLSSPVAQGMPSSAHAFAPGDMVRSDSAWSGMQRSDSLRSSSRRQTLGHDTCVSIKQQVSYTASELFALQEAEEDPCAQVLREHRAALLLSVMQTPRTEAQADLTRAQALGIEYESVKFETRECENKWTDAFWPGIFSVFTVRDAQCMDMVLKNGAPDRIPTYREGI